MNGDYRLRRPRTPLREEQVRALRRIGERHLGRGYDARFEWSDRRMYCSELVWKMYARGIGMRWVTPAPWSELRLTPRAGQLAHRRLGRLPAANARVVTPAALLDSPHLFEPETNQAGSTRPPSSR